MAELISVLKNVRGLYADRSRDRLPEGSVWELVDWVPEIMQAGARMRGAWLYQSDALPNNPDGMLYTPFRAGAKLLVANGADLRVIPTTSIGSTSIGTIPATKQNPVFHRDRVIVPASNGTSAPRYITFNGTVYTLTDGPASALTGKYATVWKDRLVLANSIAFPSRVAYSKPGDPTAAFDAISIVDTSYDVTALATMRNQVLAFHDSAVERLRGTTPPDSTLSDPTGDLILDSLFDKAGCYDARSVAYWNENVVFCDSRGIHLTDGAATKNVTQQAGVMNLWRTNWERPSGTPPLTTGGVVHRDYYIVTVRHTGQTPTTFVADMTTRRVFMLANCDCSCWAVASGTIERLFGSEVATKKVTDTTPIFSPNPSILQVDADGDAVLPVIATGWYPLSKEPALKRVEDLHLSYEAYVDVNLITNPSFEVNTSGWIANTGTEAFWGRSETFAKYGIGSLKVIGATNGSGGGAYYVCTAFPKAITHTFSVWALIAAGVSRNAILYYENPTTVIAGPTQVGDGVTWKRLTVSGQWATGSTNPLAGVIGLGANETIYLDGGSIVLASDVVDPEVFRLAYIGTPNGENQDVGEFRATTKYERKKIRIGRRLHGVGFRLRQLTATRDSRLYDFSLRAYPEEDTDL